MKFIFAWYDLWIGIYWDKKKRRLYILPIPMVGIYIQFFVVPENYLIRYWGESAWIVDHNDVQLGCFDSESKAKKFIKKHYRRNYYS